VPDPTTMQTQPLDSFPNPRPRYRLDLLPVVPPFYRRARANHVGPGELVYYGPAPLYYGIGEVVGETDRHVVVDFRGTGMFGVHQETIERHYVLPIPPEQRGLL
ncbi:MAG TPA: hypothetical protein VK002_06610, partial [Rubricoccaceae bacterium]|nr:hypothetical protein [Rubricoccaceae bacterium]